jgi:undecaprenol kinase
MLAIPYATNADNNAWKACSFFILPSTYQRTTSPANINHIRKLAKKIIPIDVSIAKTSGLIYIIIVHNKLELPMGLKHPTTKSFYYAFQGLHTALRQEPNLRVHFIAATLALILGLVLKLSMYEWLLLTFTIFYVITLELLNTVLEAIVDLVSPDIVSYAKVAKDVSAACVLLAAFMSIIVGVVLFVPKILVLIH